MIRALFFVYFLMLPFSVAGDEVLLIKSENLSFVFRAFKEIESEPVSAESHDLRYVEDAERIIIMFIPSGLEKGTGRGNVYGGPVLELVFCKESGDLLSKNYVR